jgi:hypothetical protein
MFKLWDPDFRLQAPSDHAYEFPQTLFILGAFLPWNVTSAPGARNRHGGAVTAWVEQKQKRRPDGAATARTRSLCILIGQGDQATLSAGPFCSRRYAMKPSPQKPRIIIAHVEGSGTAGAITAVATPLVRL